MAGALAGGDGLAGTGFLLMAMYRRGSPDETMCHVCQTDETKALFCMFHNMID